MVLILLGLSSITDESLLLNLPSELDIIDVLSQQRTQKEELLKMQLDYIKDQEELLKNYKEQINEQKEYVLLEELAQDEQRLKDIEEQLKNAYMLSDRDGPLDYQNLFDDGIKNTFIIDFDSSEWQKLIDNMIEYNNLYGSYKSNEYVKVDVSYFSDTESFYIPDVGIRSKGNTSRRLPVNGVGDVVPIHYVLKFNETFDTVEGTTEYEWLKKREVFDVEQLLFKWNKNYDATYSSEVYANRLFNAAGVAMPSISLSKYIIRIDGEIVYEDLYSVQEVIDEEFIRKQLQDIPTDEVGDLYKVIWGGTLESVQSWQVGVRDWENNYRPIYGLETNNKTPNYSNLVGFSQNLASYSGDSLKTFLEGSFDIDNWIRAMAINVLLGNPDDIRGNANNYYLYFDEYNYLTYIPYDYDHCLGQGWIGGLTPESDIYDWWRLSHSMVDYVPIVDKVLEIEEYQVLYEHYLTTFMDDEYFSYESFSNMFNTLQSTYGDEFDMSNDKEWFFTRKENAVLEDIVYYRSLRD